MLTSCGPDTLIKHDETPIKHLAPYMEFGPQKVIGFTVELMSIIFYGNGFTWQSKGFLEVDNSDLAQRISSVHLRSIFPGVSCKDHKA